jgi:transcriptional regulator with XRE-family HTH domain
MEMQVHAAFIRAQREKRAWSQLHLARVSGLGLRTIQRIESRGTASYESAGAIASAFALTVADLIPPKGLAISSSGSEQRRRGRNTATRWYALPAGANPLRAGIGWSAIAAVGVALVYVNHRTPSSFRSAEITAESSPAEVPVSEPAAIAAECPVQLRYTRQLNMAMDCEPIDSDWAPEIERRLSDAARSYLAEHPDVGAEFRFRTARCRSTICEMQFFDSTPAGTFRIDPSGRPDIGLASGDWFPALQGEIFATPWGAEFDFLRTSMIGSAVDGELRIYLQKNFEQVSRR